MSELGNFFPEKDYIGKKIGNWKIMKKLGEGGMSIVFQAEHIENKQFGAIKLLRPELCKNYKLIRRFQREAETAGKLEHKGIIKVWDFGHDKKEGFYMAMEYLEGVDLDQIMDKAPFPKSWILSFAEQVCSALDLTHKNAIIHRDLKPSNIFILNQKGLPKIKVLDFGIAKAQFQEEEDQKLTSTGAILGTPNYLAPEQVVPKDGLTSSIDIYAMGIILYEMLTGHLPLTGVNIIEYAIAVLQQKPKTLAVYRPELKDSPLEEFFVKILAKKPSDRYSSMAEVWLAFKEAAQSIQDPLDKPANFPKIEEYIEPSPLSSAPSHSQTQGFGSPFGAPQAPSAPPEQLKEDPNENTVLDMQAISENSMRSPDSAEKTAFSVSSVSTQGSLKIPTFRPPPSENIPVVVAIPVVTSERKELDPSRRIENFLKPTSSDSYDVARRNSSSSSFHAASFSSSESFDSHLSSSSNDSLGISSNDSNQAITRCSSGSHQRLQGYQSSRSHQSISSSQLSSIEQRNAEEELQVVVGRLDPESENALNASRKYNAHEMPSIPPELQNPYGHQYKKKKKSSSGTYLLLFLTLGALGAILWWFQTQ